MDHRGRCCAKSQSPMKSVVHNPKRHADCSGMLDESHDAKVARRRVLGLLVTRGHTVWRRLICSATSAGYSDIPVSKRLNAAPIRLSRRGRNLEGPDWHDNAGCEIVRAGVVSFHDIPRHHDTLSLSRDLSDENTRFDNPKLSRKLTMTPNLLFHSHRIPASVRRSLSKIRGWLRMPRRLLQQSDQWGLFWTIVTWVGLAIVVFTLLGWLWGTGSYFSWRRLFTNWAGNEPRDEPLELVKVSLTTVGGIGAVSYLVIKYRERASAERNEVDAKLLSAVQQLGSNSPQVRIAGVYALTDVADTYRNSYRQRVVDILCGYLRTERGHWESVREVVDAQTTGTETEADCGPRYVTTDGPVESTILAVLARHLRKTRIDSRTHRRIEQEVNDDQLWCDCEIDLHDTHFTERVVLTGITCRRLNAHDVHFDDYASMASSTFTESVSFCRAVFSGEACFSRSIFHNFANFNEVIFKDHAWFNGSYFTDDARFRGIRHKKYKLNFGGARFNINYWHSDPPIFTVAVSADPIIDMLGGAGWADFSGETPQDIDDPDKWRRTQRSHSRS